MYYRLLNAPFACYLNVILIAPALLCYDFLITQYLPFITALL